LKGHSYAHKFSDTASPWAKTLVTWAKPLKITGLARNSYDVFNNPYLWHMF